MRLWHAGIRGLPGSMEMLLLNSVTEAVLALVVIVEN